MKRTLTVALLAAVLGFFAGILAMQPALHASAADPATEIDRTAYRNAQAHDWTLVAERTAAPESPALALMADAIRWRFPALGALGQSLLASSAVTHYAPAYVMPGRVRPESYSPTAASELFYWDSATQRWTGPFPVAAASTGTNAAQEQAAH